MKRSIISCTSLIFAIILLIVDRVDILIVDVEEDPPEVQYKDDGERHYKVQEGGGNCKVQRSLIQIFLMKRHAAPGGLCKVCSIVLDVVHLGKD